MPVVNPRQSDEDDNSYHSPAEEDPSVLVSPHRPHQSASASPRALLRPDPPPTDEVLAGAAQQLRVNPTRQERALNRNAVRQAQEAAEAARQGPPAAIMVNYDQQNEEDEAGAIQNARDCKLPFNKENIKLWFSLIESKMMFAGIKKQWSKRQVLVQLIPPDIHSDFIPFLQMQETEAGNQAYYDFKSAIIKQFGPKQADNFDKAISRVLTGKPSELGRRILNDICLKPKPLQGCCCNRCTKVPRRRTLFRQIATQTLQQMLQEPPNYRDTIPGIATL